MPRTKGGFRVDRKKFGLTWSAIKPEHVPEGGVRQPIETHHEIIAELERIGGVCTYTVAKEYHKDGAVHWHAMVEYDTKFESSNARAFDIKGIHPNIINPKGGWYSYVRKAGEIVTNIEEGPWARALACDNAKDAIEMLWKNQPEAMCKQAHVIEPNIQARMKRKAEGPPPYNGPYTQHVDWPNNKCLFIHGEAGLGKTQWAKYLLGPDHFYLKGSLERLRYWNGEDPLIFDEWPYTDVKNNQPKVLLDMDDGADIVLSHNKTVEVPAGTRKVFVSNSKPEDVWDMDDYAVKRRLVCYEFKQ